MRSLKALAEQVDLRQKVLPPGRGVHLLCCAIRFPSANPPRLTNSELPQTYTSKPLVQVGDESLFGELAILHYLRDGNSTYHNQRPRVNQDRRRRIPIHHQFSACGTVSESAFPKTGECQPLGACSQNLSRISDG